VVLIVPLVQRLRITIHVFLVPRQHRKLFMEHIAAIIHAKTVLEMGRMIARLALMEKHWTPVAHAAHANLLVQLVLNQVTGLNAILALTRLILY
jgi:hypothetical protein